MKDKNVKYIMENYQTKTDKEIATFVGCHPSTIKHYRLDLGLLKRRIAILNCPHIEREIYSLGMCRSCYEKNLRQSNPDYASKQRENSNGWAKKNKERKSKLNLEWVHNNLDRVRHNKWILNLKKDFDMSEDGYNILWYQQDGKCAVCGQKPNYKLVVDHNHATNKVRGLLCRQCNLLLGLLSDDIDKTNKVISYLEKYDEQ